MEVVDIGEVEAPMLIEVEVLGEEAVVVVVVVIIAVVVHRQQY